ncbi:MAG: hypothetical protein AAF679_04500 [Pseudomonadota bacterium]
MGEPEEIMRVPVSPARRAVASGLQAFLGLLFLSMVGMNDAPVWWGPWLLGLVGLAFLGFAWGMWRAGALSLVLRQDGLYDSSGACIAPLSEIVKVDRGIFAMKPSNGFLVVTRTPGGRAWVPGLWWRMGRRIGVGGTPAGRMARQMADVLSALVAERDGGQASP